ncbi:trehalase-like domain-containing protein [Streptomyces sp. NPDC018833]|uniref:trehalase-like domain-containing protein n=1 Tax=Streptomyces sp. NPDC018833 TaxID=3365053 RepID=UPI0037BA74C1
MGRDGSVDWLGLPDLDSPTVFAAAVDAARGGQFQLEPEVSYRMARRYLPGTNVLETTFTTDAGTARVTDALTLHDDAALGPMRELQRRIDGLAGTVPMHWSVRPRFGYGTGPHGCSSAPAFRWHRRAGTHWPSAPGTQASPHAQTDPSAAVSNYGQTPGP